MRKLFRPLCIFFLALAPRVYQLGRDVINIDASFWKENTYNFMGLFFQRRFGDMVITHHPGVTLMWLGGLGMKVFRALYLWTQRVPAPDTAAVYLATHFAQKLPIALLTAAFVVFVYWSVKKLVGEQVAVIAAVLLALEPFFLAHSRVFHLDALLTVFMCSSVLMLLLYLQERNRRWLVFSGVLGGLALLTKSTALFLVPFVLLTVLIKARSKLRYYTQEFVVANFSSRLLVIGIWCLTLVVTFVVVWPAMWVGPIDALRVYFSGIFTEANATDPAFFAASRHVIFGQLTYDPGAYYYPFVLALRLSPVVFIFGVLGGVGAIRDSLRKRSFSHPLLLTLYSLLFLLMLSIPAKKLDRYILPVLPFFCILAASCIRALIKSLPLVNAVVAVFSALVIFRVLTFARFHPDYGFYFSPLFGGTQVGLQFDSDYWWGEGYRKAADYLNQKDGASELVVGVWNDRSFKPFFDGVTHDLGGEYRELEDYWVRSPHNHYDGFELEHTTRVGDYPLWGVFRSSH